MKYLLSLLFTYIFCCLGHSIPLCQGSSYIRPRYQQRPDGVHNQVTRPVIPYQQQLMITVREAICNKYRKEKSPKYLSCRPNQIVWQKGLRLLSSLSALESSVSDPVLYYSQLHMLSNVLKHVRITR
jgi:hypothetical protein